MMKSFFKKLSLVMALAMVVTLAAPAAQAFAADLIIAGQEEAKADAKESYSVEVGGEPIDFKFYGAAAGWQDLYKWESSDETIAKPLVNEKGEQDGRFEALKDGEVEVILTIGEQKATVKLVVGEGVVVDDKSFVVDQKTANSVNITFADAKYATTGVTVEKLIKTTSGEVTGIVWPVNTVTVKDGVATVTTWVDFGTGDYRFTANGESVEKLMKVGEPNFAVITYKDAYTYTDNGNKAITPDIKVYDEAGVQLTGYNNWYFELQNTDADAYLESDGTLYLWNVGAKADIKATLTYVVGTEAKTIVAYAPVTCQTKPAYEVNKYLEKYALVDSYTAADKIVWGKTDVIIDDGSYTVAGIIKDSDGKELTFADLAGKGYKVTFESSNPSVALVGVDGEVIGVNPGKAYALVTLYQKADQDIYLGVIAAVPVNVVAAKKATVVTLDKTVATLLTSGDFTTVEVTATTKNQYNGDQPDSIASVIAKDSKGNPYYATEISGNKFTIDAKDLHDAEVNSLTYTVEMNSGLKATFVLNLKRLPAQVNETYALVVNGAKVFENETAKVEVVSAWAGSNLSKKPFYFGKPADADIQKDDLYVTITGPDGKDITTKAGTFTALEFNAVDATSTATSGAIKTMAAGKYVVKLNRVTQRIEADNKVIVQTVVCDTEVFEIVNNLPGVTDFKVKSNKYTAANAIGTDTVEFKVNGTAWDGNNFTVDAADVNAKELDGSIYVYGFTVKVPYKGDSYYTVYVPVNELFTAK